MASATCLSISPPLIPIAVCQPYADLTSELWALWGEKPQTHLCLLLHIYVFRNMGSVPCWAVGWDQLKSVWNQSSVAMLHLCCCTVYYYDCLETSFLGKEPELLLPLSLKEGNWHTSELSFWSSLKDPALHWQELLSFRNNSRKKPIWFGRGITFQG